MGRAVDTLDQDLESNFRRTPSYLSADPTLVEGYEDGGIGDGNVQPVGWVQNAQTDTGVATVVIDSEGITITEGALTFVDQFGETVLSGAGFGASWVDFLSSMVYNHAFRAGTTNDITAATDSNGGHSVADYEAGISSDLPYWVIGAESGAGTLKRVADTDAVSGFALQWSGNEDGTIYQDVPVIPGQQYSVYLNWKYTNSASSFTVIVGCQFLDKDHAEISGVPVLEQSLLISTSQSSYITEYMNTSNVSTNKARYLRVSIQVQRTSGSPTVAIAAVNVDPTIAYGSTRVIEGSMSFDSGFGVAWWGGVTVDVALIRDQTARVKLYNPLGANGALYINNTNDVTLTSEDHALTIGNENGANLGLDGNEILARDNGSASTLFLNRDSGDVEIGDGGSRLIVNGGITITGVGVASGSALLMGANAIEFADMGTAPGVPASTGEVRLYVDNNAGTRRLRAKFWNGTTTTLASS